MKKSVLYAILTFSFLFFMWWFTGGHIIYGVRLGPSPAEQTFAFIKDNFQTGLAAIFDLLGR